MSRKNQHDDRDDTGRPPAGRSLSPAPEEFTRELPPGVLENLVLQDRYTVIDEKLADVVATASPPPAWLDAWRHSTRNRTGPLQEPLASPEERLAVWKQVRDSGLLPPDAGFFLVASEVELLTEIRVGEVMAELDRATDALWAERGLEHWRSQVERDSEHFEEFQERCPEDWDRLYVDMLTRHGEPDFARLYRADRERFEQRLRSGREFFYPPQPSPPAPPPPAWPN